MGERMPPSFAAATGETLEMLQELEDDHQIQRALCHDLEAIADALPKAPSHSQLRRVAERIVRVSTEHHPHAVTLLRSLPADSRPSEADLAALEAMHLIDAIHGEDLITALWNYVETNPDRHEGELGYMLRCYFDGCRRAMAFKEALIGQVSRHAAGGINWDGR